MSALILSRSSIKGRMTKFKNFIELLKQKESISPKEADECSLRLDRFRSLLNKFDELQTQIEIADPASMDSEIDVREEIEKDFYSLMSDAKKLIDSATDKTEYESIKSEVQSVCNHHENELNFRLPLIKIASFDGSYFKWLEFRESFDALINKIERIKPIHKFHYLNSYLEGEAAQVISNLEATEANYTEAWRLLCERYDNKKQLISNHLISLFNIQPVGRESAKALRYLVDHVSKNLRALNTLGCPTAQWDILIIHMVSAKLDNNTSLKWEEFKNDNINDDLPSLADFNRFLKGRADILESVQRNRSEKQVFNNKREPHFPHNKQEKAIVKTFAISATSSAASSAPASASCFFCQGDHRIYDCSSFLALSVEDRISGAAKLNLCLNCLRKGHTSHRCRAMPCRTCKKRHNTLLHREVPQIVNTRDVIEPSASPPQLSSGLACNNMTVAHSNNVLLSTALIDVYNPVTNEYVVARALLDSGSMTSLITNDLKQKLHLIPQPNAVNVVGVGNVPLTGTPERCAIQIRSRYDDKTQLDISCLVLPTISSNLPQTYIDISRLKMPHNLKLADPTFNEPSSVDVLIGADLFWHLIGSEQFALGDNMPVMRKSKLGWILAGPISVSPRSSDIFSNHSVQCNHLSTCDSSLDESLTKFWELEQIPQPKKQYTDIEDECEKHFVTHTYRDVNGRFFVRLPLITEPDCLGDSFHLAKKRFLALEGRFDKNPALKKMYQEFIREYAELGHLSVSATAIPDPSFFVPHHAVLKPTSESTKIRIVFCGNAVSSSGYSVNDLQMIGATIQDSLFNILLRFRTYRYVLTGDVEKLYRQVMVQECDRDLQLILWRDNVNEPLQTLRLNTVTYGYSAASFLSARCLWQLGEECSDTKIKNIIQNDFLVDDLLTGADTEEELISIKKSVERALAAGCFPLRKYRSNSPSVLQGSQNPSPEKSLIISSSSHTLGVGWDSAADVIHFPTEYSAKDQCPTKRTILSDSCKIFDPLGVLSLLTIIPKILIQKLWILRIGWDEPVPEPIKSLWRNFVNNLPYLTSLQLPRYIICDCPVAIELHCFCDASQAAYASCIYLKSTNNNGDVTTRLLCAKARVCPVKVITVPRAELSACLLGAQLASAVLRTLRCQIVRTVYWTDSSICLSWLGTNYNKLKTFVSNRVASILELTDGSEWRHVPTSLNPADYGSRGVDAYKLPDLDMWWNGPSFLREPERNWPQFSANPGIDLPELKANVNFINTARTEPVLIDLDRYSKLKHLQRSLAYVLRFIYNCLHPADKLTGVLQPEELKRSFHKLVHLAQQETFSHELKILRNKQVLSPKNKIISLNPFVDNEGLLRVGGRLASSFYAFEKRHPLILNAKHRLTKLLFRQEHLRLLHAPPQLIHSSVREFVWAVRGRDLARTVARQCVTCRRAAGNTSAPLMGRLPPERVTPDFPFVVSAVDFAGPFLITDRHGRGCKITKCYLAVFVCTRYKCVHLEAVSQLSTDSFILTLRRFISRRGKPRELLCDNGRNFTGAAKELSDFLKVNSNHFSNFASDEGIKFKFSPAYAPHFNGLVEACVRSAKYHLRRILGNAHLTFEELATLFSQVEAILNSRPLCPLSSSPNDFQPLTPGYFLIGRALTSLPSPSLLDVTQNRLDRFQRLETLRQHFWKRWQLEYVSELQQRTKWRVPGRSFKVDDLVLLKEENAPPLHWRMGRIAKLFPGSNGISRVADVATSTGIYRRGVAYLCPLLDETDESLKTGVFKGPQDVEAATSTGVAGVRRA